MLGPLGVFVSVVTPSWDETANVELVAVVSGKRLTRGKYLTYLQALATDKKDPISSEDSRYVLQRMIEAELTEFFLENIDYFTPTARLRAQQLVVKGGNAEQRALQAYQRLVSGDDFFTVNTL